MKLKGTMILMLLVVAVGLVWADVAQEPVDVREPAPALNEVATPACAEASSVDQLDLLELNPAARKKPPARACCDPGLQPGTNGNPFCFEGATCCSDGVWRCNFPNGKPSCSVGSVCKGR